MKNYDRLSGHRKDIAHQVMHALEREQHLERALRALLVDRGLSMEGFSVTLLKDGDGYFSVYSDRGVLRVEVEPGCEVTQ